LDDSVDSNKMMNQKLVGVQGQIKLAKKVKTCPHYDVNHREPQTKTKTFFFPISTRLLAQSIVGLNNPLAQSAGKLWRFNALQKRGVRRTSKVCVCDCGRI